MCHQGAQCDSPEARRSKFIDGLDAVWEDWNCKKGHQIGSVGRGDDDAGQPPPARPLPRPPPPKTVMHRLPQDAAQHLPHTHKHNTSTDTLILIVIKLYAKEIRRYRRLRRNDTKVFKNYSGNRKKNVAHYAKGVRNGNERFRIDAVGPTFLDYL